MGYEIVNPLLSLLPELTKALGNAELCSLGNTISWAFTLPIRIASHISILNFLKII
jgi:hypothetical protein